MDSFTHMIPAIFLYLIKIGLSKVNFIFLLIGSVIPDLDHGLGFLYKTLTKSWNKNEDVLKGMQKIFFFPRTAFHSLWGVLTISTIFYFLFGLEHTAYLSLGFTIHLLIDSIDEAGVYWLFPYGKLHWKFPASYLQSKKYTKYYKIQKIFLMIDIVIVLLFFLIVF